VLPSLGARRVRKLDAKMSVTFVKSESGWALVAREGRPLGYVALRDIMSMHSVVIMPMHSVVGLSLNVSYWHFATCSDALNLRPLLEANRKRVEVRPRLTSTLLTHCGHSEAFTGL